ncbi:MmcQ/YjbR family DNA-binding protein [Schleiferilactobacillus shenzhenensis]|uniref:YjbR n=1 Tax=Schleiferilactobacillus shenzhenensis LY-73 TaxID=1231336 RepID=U4TX59_9LACO|nr:MmcQ/YjbR family DNA-binding protein [Schleiferilactobacillus shenzhenensis]ERL65937.1 hypothetical protein L248_2013 [Schleiferilactobacillus shenzhenensis LY-73]
MTIAQLVSTISQGQAITTDQPFNRPGNHNRIIFTAVRHAASKKIFALIYHQDGRLYMDLKADPAVAAELSDALPYITAGRHFDKQHWLTVDVNAVAAPTELIKLAAASYQLTA